MILLPEVTKTIQNTEAIKCKKTLKNFIFPFLFHT